MQAFAIFLSTLSLLPNGYYCGKQMRMALSEDDMKALRLLIGEELEAKLQPFRNEVSRRFDEVATQIDGLYQRDEKRAPTDVLP